MNATTTSVYGLAVIAELSTTLMRFSGVANVIHARVGHLLAHSSVTSPQRKA